MFPILRIKKYVACVIDIRTPAGVVFFSGLCFSRSFEAKTPPLAPQHSDYNRVHSFKELGKEETKTYVLSRKWFKFSHRNSFRFAKKEELKQKMFYESGQFVKKQQLVAW